jgi:hypothetical protein
MQIAGRLTADSPPVRRRIVRIDGRSKPAKRAKQLAAGFIARLGGGDADIAMKAAVQKAAELAAVAEELRGRALRGESVDLGELVRVEGIADRALRAIGITPGKPPTSGQTLAQYLASTYGAQAGEDAPDVRADEDGAEGETRTGDARTVPETATLQDAADEAAE